MPRSTRVRDARIRRVRLCGRSTRSHNKPQETVNNWTKSGRAKRSSVAPGYEICIEQRMPNVAASIEPPSTREVLEVCKQFDIRAEHPLQLELRLDAFSRALVLRGGRVLGVSRSQKPEGVHLASVQYSLPLPPSTSRFDD